MPTSQELKAAQVWEAVDRVPGDEEMTDFRRRVRLRQARWRERSGLPIGVQRTREGGTRAIGSRIEPEYAHRSGANFLTDSAREAASSRAESPERHQTLDKTRLWADLLSSMPMCFNLLGDLHADHDLATQVAQKWFPDLGGTVGEVRFEWSPGRADPDYLNNRTAFDAALIVQLSSDRHGVVGIETKYHERPVVEKQPEPAKLQRYLEVADKSGVFKAGARKKLVETVLQQIWLDHLLVLSMLQHPSGQWATGRFVLVHPEENVGFARVAHATPRPWSTRRRSRSARSRSCSTAGCRRRPSPRSATATSRTTRPPEPRMWRSCR